MMVISELIHICRLDEVAISCVLSLTIHSFIAQPGFQDETKAKIYLQETQFLVRLQPSKYLYAKVNIVPFTCKKSKLLGAVVG